MESKQSKLGGLVGIGEACRNRLRGQVSLLVLLFLSSAVPAQTTVAGATPASFEVSPSGAATYRIPIAVPPGVGGVEPAFELAYNSQAGNGLLGMGWALTGGSVITRCPQTTSQDGSRIGVTLTATDRFCLDGQRLMVVAGTYGASGSEYRTEIESFSRVTASGGNSITGPASFRVQTKAGLTMDYGTTADSRIEAQGKTAIMSWALNRVSDARGNAMNLTYSENNATGEFELLSASYSGGNAVVSFVYETRADTRISYMAGSQVRQLKRLQGVEVRLQNRLIRSYEIAYHSASAVNPSRPQSITECGYVQAVKNCLSAITFSYASASNITGGNFTYFRNQTHTSDDRLGWGLMPVDVDGDGCQDLMAFYVGSEGFKTQISRSECDGNFTLQAVQTLSSSNFTGWGVLMGDINGDGKQDIILHAANNRVIHYGLSGSDFSFTYGSFSLPNVPVGISQYAAIVSDFNGDGRSDVMLVGSNASAIPTYGIRYALNNSTGNGTFVSGYGGTNTSVNYGNLYASDFNGDGKSDLALYVVREGGWANHSYEINLLLSTSGSDFVAGNRLTGGGVGYPLPIVDFSDINGDGLDDIVITRNETSITHLSDGAGGFRAGVNGTFTTGLTNRLFTSHNEDGFADMLAYTVGTAGLSVAGVVGRGGGTFSVLPTTALTATSLSGWKVMTADVNGDGRADVVAYRINASGTRTIVALANAGSPDLVRIASATSGTTSIEYRALSSRIGPSEAPTEPVYVKGTTGSYPTINLQTSSRVVLKVVTSSTGTPSNSTRYRYGGLRAQLGNGRGSLGFEWMRVYAPSGLETTTTLGQGFPHYGLPVVVETRVPSLGTANEGLLKRIANYYGSVRTYDPNPASSSGPGKVTFAWPTSTVEDSWDVSGTRFPRVTTSYTYGVDPVDGKHYGDVQRLVVQTSHGSHVSSKTTDNEYWPANVAGSNWILGRLRRATVTSVAP